MMFSSNINNYKFLEQFKDGQFGTVYKAKCENSSGNVVIEKILLDQQTEKFDFICKQIINIRQFKHQNINTLVHCFIQREYAYLMYPYMCFGNCQFLLENVYTSGFSEILIALIVKDILSALIYIHSHNFVHGAIRAKLVLLNSMKASLSNSGDYQTFINHGRKSQFLYGSTKGKEKQLNWTAPEVLHQSLCGYSEKVDIYSLGITCCEMANGFQPFKGAELTYMYIEKIRGNLPFLMDKSSMVEEQGSTLFHCHNRKISRDLFVKNTFSDDFYQFVELCLTKSPTARWSASKLVTHSFLKQCRNTSISENLKDISFDLDKSKFKEGKCYN
ncbi:hypothetical protein KR054_003646, partial [Drosophila jambulina]